MADFKEAIEYVLKREGGLSENPNDSGGITHFGISLRFLREVKWENLRKYGIFGTVDENTIRNLSIEQAKLIYKGEFWEGNHFDEIESQTLCNYIFDMAVNLGIGQAARIIQRASWALTFTRLYLRDDGIIGPKTIGVINSLGEELLPILVAIRGEFYRSLVMMKPKEEANLNGWLERCYSVLVIA